MNNNFSSSNESNVKFYTPKNGQPTQSYGFQNIRPKTNFRRQIQSEPNDNSYNQSTYGQRNNFQSTRDENFVAERNSRVEANLFTTSNSGINFDAYDSIPVECKGNDVPLHMKAFSAIDFGEILNLNINLCNYNKPTPIQKYAIPILLAKRDMMACAQTGSGKTAAFVLPIVHQLHKEMLSGEISQGNQYLGPKALIVAPTRELAQQIYLDSKRLTYRTGIKSTAIYGGCSQYHQVTSIRNGCDILIATPGRLIDLLNQNIFSLCHCRFLILDEADRMLDMGFEPQIRKAMEIGKIPSNRDRQTIMFSATFPPKIQQLGREFLHDEIFVTVGRIGSISENITQSVIWVSQSNKIEKLHSIVDELKASTPDCRILIFVDRKSTVDAIEIGLYKANHRVVSIHGDRMQNEREQALTLFKERKAYIMVATDVAQRGLDIPNVTHVINYSFPSDIEDYTHRIGRTGRAGNTGTAITFFDDSCSQFAGELKKLLIENKQVIPDFLNNFSSFQFQPKRDNFRSNKNFRDNRSNNNSSFDRFAPRRPTSSSYWDD